MKTSSQSALRFIYLLGITSLFADVTYEGARSIAGPYLSILGASAATIGLVAGLGEFIGYGLRLVSGYLSDRLGRHWLFTFLGYATILSMPALAFARRWEIAAILIILERSGKAIRTPARDAMLSHASRGIGSGKGFGLHEALDQIGAVTGPLVIAGFLYFGKTYRLGFAVLVIPAILSLLVLSRARAKFPAPALLEESDQAAPYKHKNKLPRIFWLYTLFTVASVAGFAHFLLISYHFKAQAIVSDAGIPVLFALAMGIDGLVALIIGRIYDRIGFLALISAPILTALTPFFIFSQRYSLLLGGIVLWGMVMGIQETIMRAAIADITPAHIRGTAYGIFNTAYGLAWFIGASLMGFLYGISIKYIFGFVVITQVIAASVLFLLITLKRQLPASPAY